MNTKLQQQCITCIIAFIISLQTNSTDTTITSYPTLRNKSLQVVQEQTTAEYRTPQQETPSHPLLSDKSCQRCHYDKMSVTLVPCCHAALCTGCADDILDTEKRCPICDRCVTGFVVI